MTLAIALDARYGTPLPIALNIFVRERAGESKNSFGKDCNARASATGASHLMRRK